MVYDCIIVGGGAAGITASIELGRKGYKVLLIEQLKELGKKLYATGNGRCNFTNSQYDETSFRGDSAFANRVYEQFTYVNTITFMRSIGILEQQKQGYYYPYTNQAKTVVNAMINAQSKDNVTLCTDRIVKEIKLTKKHIYHVTTSYGKYDARCVLLACGGKASVYFKREPYNGYKLAESLGHTIISTFPALCALHIPNGKAFNWKGLRARAALSLYEGKKMKNHIYAKSDGEVQFTEKGISGIPVFQISRYANELLKQNKEVYIKLDFLPDYSVKDLAAMLNQTKFESDATVLNYLSGYISYPLCDLVCKRSDVDKEKPILTITDKEFDSIINIVKGFVVEITGSEDFDHAQVTAGGVDTAGISSDTMESVLSPGCFFAGEILNVDGTCGGYNLQFAFSSAMVAARGIEKRIKMLRAAEGVELGD